MVDEFQDIDALQYELMDTLAAHHHNLFVVGDPDQTIYTWRGADLRFLLEFDLRHANTKTIVMTKNYRSTPQVIDVANSLVSKNTMRIEKDLEPTRADGRRVLAHIARDAEAEGGGGSPGSAASCMPPAPPGATCACCTVPTT